MSDAQMELLNNLASTINEQVGQGVEPYGGTTVADMSDLEKIMQDYGQQYGENVLPSMQETGLNLLNPQEWNPEQVQDTWQKTVFNPAQQAFENEIMPNLMEKYAGSNSLSSSALNRAVAKNAGNLETQTQSQLANMMFGSWQDYQNRNLQRQQLGNNILGQTLAGANNLQQMGELPRNIEQQGLQEQAQQWMYGQPYQNPWLRLLGSGPLGVYPYGTGQKSSGSSSKGIGGLMQGAGAMMMGA